MTRNNHFRAEAMAAGIRIRRLRRNAELTLEELARMSGTSKGFLSSIERGRVLANGFLLCAIATALGVGVEHLLEGR